MKYSNAQKEIIQLIENGTVFDIPSFVSYTRKRRYVKIDKPITEEQFEKQVTTKKYYYPANLKIDKTTSMTEQEFKAKVNLHEVNPNSYRSINISLANNAGIKTHIVDGNTITIDLYRGIYVAECFADIYEFLILWQHLKDEMLIQECSCDNYVDTLALFYKTQIINPAILDASAPDLIDYSSCSISDKYFLDQDYVFCDDAFFRCQDFIGKKIYPSIHLSLFVKNNFETASEISQKKSMRVAWIAIWVSIILAIFPYISDYFQPDPVLPILDSVKNSISSIEKSTQQILDQMEIAIDLHRDAITNDTIVKELQLIIEEISQLEEILNESADDIPATE